MSVNTDLSSKSLGYSFQAQEQIKGTIIDEGGILSFEGSQGVSKVKKIVYKLASLEVTLHDNTGRDRFDDSTFGNVGLTQFWVGQTTFICREDMKAALAGLQNQGHITDEFAKKVLARLEQ